MNVPSWLVFLIALLVVVVLFMLLGHPIKMQ